MNEILHAAAAFATRGAPVSAAPYGGGHINDTYLIETDQGCRYILQRMNTYVFPKPALIMENMARLAEHLVPVVLREGGDPAREVLRPVSLKEGGMLLQSEAGVFRCLHFIPDTVCREQAQDLVQLRQAAFAFGRFGRRLDGFPAGELQEVIPRFHDTENRLQNLLAAVSSDVRGRAPQCRAEIAFCAQRKGDCGFITSRLASGELPTRVTHNDTKLSNILLDRDTGSAVCIVDLDTVMPGSALYDFGEGVRSGAALCAEDEPDTEKVAFSIEAYTAYTEGFLEGFGRRLSRREAELLPWGPRLMALENGIRFLTDHLEGDIYYKIERPLQNLDRARVALKLTRLMEEQFPEMTRIAQELYDRNMTGSAGGTL